VADTNNHLIRTIDLASGKTVTLDIAGLAPPAQPEANKKPDFADALQIDVPEAHARMIDGKIQFRVALTLPSGWKINELAPMQYWVETEGEPAALDSGALGHRTVDPPSAEFSVSVSANKAARDTVRLSLIYYYCQEDGSLCRVGSAVWHVPLTVQGDSGAEMVHLKLEQP
jgi:hypothetical protein